MNWSDVLKAVIPVIVASLAWLLGQVTDFSTRLTKIEGSMHSSPRRVSPQTARFPLSAAMRLRKKFTAIFTNFR